MVERTEGKKKRTIAVTDTKRRGKRAAGGEERRVSPHSPATKMEVWLKVLATT
jgi:hypothetical protein